MDHKSPPKIAWNTRRQEFVLSKDLSFGAFYQGMLPEAPN